MRVCATETIARFEHGHDDFTQGLVAYDDNLIIESTGLYGSSRLIYRSAADLSEVAGHPFARDFFAEGICRGPGGLVVLSWRESIALHWNVERAEIDRVSEYDREGWGICYDGTHFVTSDGTDRLTFRTAEMAPVKDVPVRLCGRPLAGLNDLQWSAPDTIWANIDSTDCLVEIDPSTGEVVSLVDASGLRTAERPGSDLMNGVAIHPATGHMLLTGKLWSWIHLVRLRPVAPEEGVIESLPRSIEDLNAMTPPANPA